MATDPLEESAMIPDWPETATPAAYTVWEQADGAPLPVQVAWSDTFAVAVEIYGHAIAEREPGSVVTLYAPGSLTNHEVGKQLAAYGLHEYLYPKDAPNA